MGYLDIVLWVHDEHRGTGDRTTDLGRHDLHTDRTYGTR